MNKFMKLEIKRNPMKKYYMVTLIITVVMLGFMYLFAAIPVIEPTGQDLEMFQSYKSLSALVSLLSMVSFSVLASVMFTRFVIEEYSGKRAILLFSYPVPRSLIFISKIKVVVGYTTIAMFISSVCVLFVFYLTESFFPIVPDTLSFATVLKSLGLALIYSVMASIVGLLSLWFGFIKKSISATIVSGVIILTILCNFLSMGTNNVIIPIAFTLVGIVAVIPVIGTLSKKVTKMEV